MRNSNFLKKKLKRLETVPDEFLNGIEKVEKQYYSEVVKLLARLKTVNGNLVLSEENRLILSEIESQLKGLLLKTSYSSLTEDFISSISKQAKITDDFLKAEFTTAAEAKIITEAGNTTLQHIRRNALYDLMEKPIDVRFVDAVFKVIDDNTVAGASFAETLSALQTTILGDTQTNGKLMQYSKQVAHDLFALSDRQYTKEVSEKLGVQWYFYSGNTIKTSRPFCVTRHNKYFHKKEVEKWADMEEWNGRIDGTNEKTIFVYAGGYGCRHSILPVSIVSVPNDVIQRNINNGNYKG